MSKFIENKTDTESLKNAQNGTFKNALITHVHGLEMHSTGRTTKLKEIFIYIWL
jgi:hypothetical protein